MKEYIKKDLYVIELIDRVKIGISGDVKRRLQNIKTGSGISISEVIYEEVFESKGNLEGKLLRLFSKYRANGEWFYKKGVVLKFLDEIKNGAKVDYDLIFKIQIKDDSISVTDKALSIFKRVREERKGVGFPASPNINTIIKSKKINYKNMLYIISDDYLTFDRKLKFDLDKISNNQKIECLRIVKYNTENPFKKERLQQLIDDVFNINHVTESEIISVIKNFFLFTTVEKCSKTKKAEEINLLNINFEYDNLLGCHYLDKKEEPLNVDEKQFIMKGEDIVLGDNFLVFNHSNEKHIVYFNEEDYGCISSLLNA